MSAISADRVIDSLTGIVRWVSDIPLDPGEPEIFNYSSKMCDSKKYFPVGCYDRNGGAGLTREAAYRAALGEAIERYCCSVYFHDEMLLGPAQDVAKNARVFGPDQMALFHPNQHSRIRYPVYTEDLALCWTSGYSLTRREPVLVPACVTYIPYYPFYRDRGEQTVGPSITTGQASAFSYRDAALRGVYEIVERDAFMITWLNRLAVPRIKIESDAKVARIYKERFAKPYLQYTLHSLATDLGIPCVLCVLIDWQKDPPMICTGGAANLSAEQAGVKALVEAAQTREWAKFLGKQKPPFVFESDYSNIDDFDKHVLLYAYGDMLQAMEFLIQSPREVSFDELNGHDALSLEEQFTIVRGAIESRGYEIAMVDLTTSDVRDCGYRVVKAFVSGMQQLEGEYTHRLLGGRRLYEIPGKLGYAIQPSFESLNSDPHPYP